MNVLEVKLQLILILMFHIQDHQNFLRLLTETENWLYEEGEDQAKQAYVDKLEELMVGPSLPQTTDFGAAVRPMLIHYILF